MIKVSIIIPAYNSEKYIKRCLNSCINQDLDDIEIIVINDGSTDLTADIVYEYANKDKRIVLINKKNEGVSIARNKGLDIAKGEYIQFLDSDDWIELNLCSYLFDKASKQNADIIITDFCQVLDNGEQKIYNDLIEEKKYQSKEYLYNLFNGIAYPSIWNKFTKKSILNNIWFPDDISLGEDLFVTCSIAIKSQTIIKINKTFLNYYKNDNSATQNNIALKNYDLCQSFKLVDNLLINEKDLSGLFKNYKLYHIINFITSKPFFDDERYINGFYSTINVLKTAEKVPDNIAAYKRFILKILITFPNKCTLHMCIIFINLLKRIIKNI